MPCSSSEARQEDRGREAVSRLEATEGALRAEIVAIEVIEAKIVDEGNLRVQVRPRSQRGVGTGDPNHLSRDCPEPMKCRNCGQEGRVVKDCPQPLRKASPEKEKKGKGKGKSKFRQVEEGGEPEEEAVEELKSLRRELAERPSWRWGMVLRAGP